MQRLVPDGLWGLAAPLIPRQRVRQQGGGTRERDTEGCSRRWCSCSPPDASGGTCRRCSPRRRPPRTAGSSPGPRLDCGGGCTSECWTSWVLAARSTGRGRSVTAPACGRKGGALTGASPVDRDKPGSKLHLLSERTSLPLVVGSRRPTPMTARRFQSWSGPSLRSGPAAARAASGRPSCTPDYPKLRAWLRQRGIIPRIACRGIESSTRLGRHRWRTSRSSPSCSATAGWPPATNAGQTCSQHSSPWPPPSPATSASPRKTRS